MRKAVPGNVIMHTRANMPRIFTVKEVHQGSFTSEDGNIELFSHGPYCFVATGESVDTSMPTLFPEKPAHDPVNHPSHYTSHPSGIECITITRHHDFNIGNAMKYMWRAGLKDPSIEKEIEDLKKAVWYLNDQIELLKTKL